MSSVVALKRRLRRTGVLPSDDADMLDICEVLFSTVMMRTSVPLNASVAEFEVATLSYDNEVNCNDEEIVQSTKGANVGRFVGYLCSGNVGSLEGVEVGALVGASVGTAVTTNDVFALQGAPEPLATIPLDVLICQLTSERNVPPHVYGLKVFPM